MNLHILAIGKKKSEYDDMIKEYQKRIVAPFDLSSSVLAYFSKRVFRHAQTPQLF